MKLTLFFIILTIDFDSIKQLIDLTRDDPTVYAIITALPDVIALLIYADIMSAIKNNFEHVAKGTTNILHRKSSSILFVETLIRKITNENHLIVVLLTISISKIILFKIYAIIISTWKSFT